MQKLAEKDKPVCPKCGSGQVRFRADKSMICSRCGYDSKVK